MGRADPAPIIGPDLFGGQVAESRSDNRKLAEFDFFCRVRRYVALGVRFWLTKEAHASCPRRHIISIKGFAGTASVQPPAKNPTT